MNLPVRKYTRLAASNYAGFQFYFVTLCCFERKKIFADEGHCERVLGLLRSECALRGFLVPAYCAMPDHLHFLCEGVEPGSDFLRLMTSFRIKSSRRFAQENGGVLWQRGYYEHVLRGGRCGGIGGVVHLAKSGEAGIGFEGAGVPVCGVVHGVEDANELERAGVDAAVERKRTVDVEGVKG